MINFKNSCHFKVFFLFLLFPLFAFVQTVTGVSSNKANGSYKSGDQTLITVTFDEAVTVTGTPTLKLETGTSDAVVNYSPGTGTNTFKIVKQ